MVMLLDIRAYKSRNYIAANDPRCWSYIGSVRPDRPSGLGTWLDREKGQMVDAPISMIRDILPQNWRKAFDRAAMWVPKAAPQPEVSPYWHDNLAIAGTVTLRDRRGRTITTLYVIPYQPKV